MREVCPIVVTHEPCVDQPRVHRIMSCIDSVFQTLLMLQEGPQDSSSGTAPSCLPSRLPDVMHMTLSRVFPLCFCILQAIKNWRWEQPGNETNSQPFTPIDHSLQ